MNAEGYTLVELIIGIVLMSLSFTFLAVTFFPLGPKAVDPILYSKASSIASAYLEEIVSKKFDEKSEQGNLIRCDASGAPACSSTLGSESESRSQYDDVDDYHNINESPPRDALGNAIDQYNGFAVSISVSYAGSEVGLPNRSLKKIDVSVTAPKDISMRFASYKGNF